MDLYCSQTVRNWGVPLSNNEEDQDHDLLRTLLEPLENIDIDSFLTPFTDNWCQTQLQALGYIGITDLKAAVPTYLQLRQLVQEYQGSGQLPLLQLTDAPRGGFERYVSKFILNISYEI